MEIKTSNANETKENSIKNVRDKSLLDLTNKILNDKSKKQFDKIIDQNISYDQLIKNIIIENEIITNEKYIAKIKINFNREKIVNLLRNNNINYTDLKSEPFLVISSYNINFINIGLDKKNSLNNYLQNKVNNRDELINYLFPNLDPNDRYILPYEKIITEDKKAFNEILDKYNLNQLIYINISKLDIQNQVDISLKIFDNDGFQKVGNLELNDSNFENLDKFFYYLSDEILYYMAEWWKNSYQINNSKFNIMVCKIISKNFNELVQIKSNINNLSQVKYINTKKIQLNSNIIEIFYYGDLKVLLKGLSLSNILYREIKGCIITIK